MTGAAPASDVDLRDRAAFAFDRLESYVATRDYAGYDPYDALRSPLVRGLTSLHPYLRIAAIQFFRRFPLNLRPVTGVTPGHNAKALGLFLTGYLRWSAVEPEEPRWRQGERRVRRWLLENASRGYHGFCWGYNFDWQSRVFFVPAGTPTVVNTSFIANAFLDRYELRGEGEDLEVARGAAEFMLRDLNRTAGEAGSCFSYTPNDRLLVHNANLLAAGVLARVHGHTGEPELRDAALDAVAYTLHHQREDGAWYYGETPVQRWIDSFHTGFNLEALADVAAVDARPEILRSIETGLDFYVRSFFEADGTPNYYHDRRGPLDIHSPAQALVTLTRFEVHDRARDVAAWTLDHMLDPRGYFHFRRGRIPNRISYMRWAQAWMFHGLTVFLNGSPRPLPQGLSTGSASA